MKIHCIYGVGYDSNIFIVEGDEPSVIDCGTGLHQDYVNDKIKKIIEPKKIRKSS